MLNGFLPPETSITEFVSYDSLFSWKGDRLCVGHLAEPVVTSKIVAMKVEAAEVDSALAG